MKIQAKNKDVKSMKLNVPIDGLVDIDENGVIEVSKRCGEMLLNGTNDWKKYSDDTEDADDEKVDEQCSKDGEQTDTETSEGEGEKQPTDEDVIEGLKKLSLEECVETAKAAEYPEKEWEKFAKNEKAPEKLMRQYLVKKYKESIKG